MEKEWNAKSLEVLVSWMGRGLLPEVRVHEMRHILELHTFGEFTVEVVEFVVFAYL